MVFSNRVYFLDSLRAMAILSVICTHYYHSVFPGASIGVSIFFALSGYLITKSLLVNSSLTWDVLWRFWVRRFFRVYPPFLFTVLLILVLMLKTGSPHTENYLHALPGILTLTKQPATFTGMGPGILWTLYVELWFYFTIPFLVLAFGRGTKFIAIASLIAALSVACLLKINISGFEFKNFTHILPANTFPWFSQLMYGALAACFEPRFPDLKISKETFHIISKSCFAILLVIIFFISNDDRQIAWPVESNIASLVTALWIFFWTKSTVDTQPGIIPYIGRVSYSVYLLHAIPLDYYAMIAWPSLTFLAFSKSWGIALGVIAAAVVMYHVIERPSIKLGKRITKSEKIPMYFLKNKERAVEMLKLAPRSQKQA